MPTIAGMRRRGYTSEAIRAFCERIGVSKRNSVVDVALLEHAVREDLNARCRRVMGVVRPLRVVLENFPEGQQDAFEAPWFADDPSKGGRSLPFGRVIYVDRDDFAEVPPKGWFRLSPGAEVRLRYAASSGARQVVKDEQGEVAEAPLHVGSESRGGNAEGRSKGQRDAPLGVRGARGGGRGAALRPALQGRAPR